jgi:hypothetical protein
MVARGAGVYGRASRLGRNVMRQVMLGGLGLAGLVLALAALTGEPGQAERARTLTPWQQHLLSGTASQALDERTQSRATHPRAEQAATADVRCPANRGANVRVNQHCQSLSDPDLAGRAQAQNETAIAQDPRRPERMVASSNDYRTGDGNCVTDFSADEGRTWRDSTPATSRFRRACARPRRRRA